MTDRQGQDEQFPGYVNSIGTHRRRHRCDDRAGQPGALIRAMCAAGTSAVLRVWAGQTDLGIDHASRALRRSPRAQASGSLYLIGAALFLGRRFEETVLGLRVAIEDRPFFPTPYRFPAACYAHIGLLDEARATIARLRALTPEVIPTYPLPFRGFRHRELYLSGLRLAMGTTE